MSAKKILDNLYLGDHHSVPQDAELVISCAEETFYLLHKKNKTAKNKYFWRDEGHVYFSFKDYPNIVEIDLHSVKQVIKIINANIKSKKIYVHCIYGINRSASLVFIYLVANGYIKADDFELAIEEFERIYPYIDPNPGWWDFLALEFPYYHLNTN